MDGAILQKLRKEKGWSQKKLAEMSGVGESSIRHVEIGKRPGSTKMAKKLACVLGVTYETLENNKNRTEIIRETLVSDFIKMLVEEDIITDPNNISDDIAKLIMINVKKEIEIIKEKKQV